MMNLPRKALQSMDPQTKGGSNDDGVEFHDVCGCFC